MAIGTMRGLQSLVDFDQLPFCKAFPKRKGGGRDCRTELKVWWRVLHPRGRRDAFRCGGLAKRVGKPFGQQFLGLGSTVHEVTMRVMEFYQHHERLTRKNWVPSACWACFCRWAQTCSAGCNAISGKGFDIRDCKRLQNVPMTIQL